MQNKFIVGQRVVVHNWHGADQIGTVLHVKGTSLVGVGFDDYVDGHDLNGLCCDGHGWFFIGGELKMLDPLPAIKYDSSWDELWG